MSGSFLALHDPVRVRVHFRGSKTNEALLGACRAGPLLMWERRQSHINSMIAELAETMDQANDNNKKVGRRAVQLALLVVFAIAGPPALCQTRPAPPPAANPIDINSASRDELMRLDGIGEVRADAIIRARPFKVKGDLVERRIIPEALYDKIADKVVARGTPTAPAQPPQPAQKRR
jgi:competence protein ComEA